jgi:hypothetical protein
MEYAAAFSEMSLAAGEIILRRTQRMATGSMTPPEALAMVLEKSTALALATERAALAAARGGDAARVMTAALQPYGEKTRSNVRKLRR